MSPLSDSKRRAVAFALVFCSGARLLFAQEQSATATISHQVRELFERAAKAVVKIHGVDKHSEICGTGFFVDRRGHFTLRTPSEVKPAISQSNLEVRNARRANSWQTSAAAQPS